MANPIQGGAKVLAGQSSDRKTALALVLAIAASQLLLSGQMQAIWKALWGPTRPLGATVSQASTNTATTGGTK